MITPDELRAMRERCEKATPGEWFFTCDGPDDPVQIVLDENAAGNLPVIATLAKGPNAQADAQFIAGANRDVPRLLDEVERLQRIERAARDALAFLPPATARGNRHDPCPRMGEDEMINLDAIKISSGSHDLETRDPSPLTPAPDPR